MNAYARIQSGTSIETKNQLTEELEIIKTEAKSMAEKMLSGFPKVQEHFSENQIRCLILGEIPSEKDETSLNPWYIGLCHELIHIWNDLQKNMGVVFIPQHLLIPFNQQQNFQEARAIGLQDVFGLCNPNPPSNILITENNLRLELGLPARNSFQSQDED